MIETKESKEEMEAAVDAVVEKSVDAAKAVNKTAAEKLEKLKNADTSGEAADQHDFEAEAEKPVIKSITVTVTNQEKSFVKKVFTKRNMLIAGGVLGVAAATIGIGYLLRNKKNDAADSWTEVYEADESISDPTDAADVEL